MSSQRRSGRKRSANTRIVDLQETSPSHRAQPNAKRRKANAPSLRPNSSEEEDSETQEDDSSDETASEPDHAKLAETLIPFLDVAVQPVEVAKTGANHLEAKKHENSTITAFAKICGRRWTFYIKQPKIVFGRHPEEAQQSTAPGVTSDESKGEEEMVDLGPTKTVSRAHAELYFDQKDDDWHIQVLGRNGIKINDSTLKRGDDEAIQSGDVISIAGTQMLFQTASGSTRVHPAFVEKIKAHKTAAKLTKDPGSNRPVLPDRQMQDPTFQATCYPQPPLGGQHPYNGQYPYALAAPWGQRPVTPDSAAKKAASASAIKRSPGYRRGIMMESTEQIDYSLESSRDLKPACSYAAMITWAILSTKDGTLSLNGIYEWIKEHYAYYRLVPSGWQNSIRHNLSLNPAFSKVARKSDEPGKGMKWLLTPEHREASIAAANKNMSKGGGRTSSAPASPGIASGFAPGPNGGVKVSPERRTPPLSSYPPTQQESYTPSRGPTMPPYPPAAYAPTQASQPVLSDGTSPVSRRRTTNGHLAANVDSSPTLTSGPWLSDAPLRTPAPRPHNLNVPQPNTVKLPTSHMPDSSPAPFWKYAGDGLGSTPAGRWHDMSPQRNGSTEVAPFESSSPPPIANGGESPSRGARNISSLHVTQNGNSNTVGPANGNIDDEEGGVDVDLTK